MLTPLNRSGDAEGCIRHGDGSVTTPKGFKRLQQYADGGWMDFRRIWGQGLPEF
jgi:hypothetical protein